MNTVPQTSGHMILGLVLAAVPFITYALWLLARELQRSRAAGRS